MNKYVIFLICLLAIFSPLQGQQNPIFGGGRNQGNDLAHYSQAQSNAIFEGGGDDGNHVVIFSQPEHSAIFYGGADDGMAQTYFGIPQHSNIFNGGSGAGFMQAYHSIQQYNPIFNGGSDDGHAQAFHVTPEQSGIFLGGSGDGVDVFRVDGLPMIYNPAFAVEILEFDAWPEKDFVQVQWVTVSELNHDYFLVEKSQDLRQFELVDQVKGEGEFQTVQAYDLQDATPFPGISYYRLKSVDLNGEVEISPWVEVRYELDARISSTVYPNPSSNRITIKIRGEVDTNIQVEIFDLMGRHTGLISHIDPMEGQLETNMEVSSLPVGIYLVRIVDAYGEMLGTHRIQMIR